MKEHWNKKYGGEPITQLGWYEARSTPSIQMIQACGVAKDAAIVDAGSGASRLIANLLELGYEQLIAVDISEVALEKAREGLTIEQAAQVRWLVDDLTNPSSVQQLENIAVWHDRAVFHFLTEEQDRQTYHALLQKCVMPGGFVVMATFAADGARMCSGLAVQRYSAEGLSEFLGDGFQLVEAFDHTYRMPSGDVRPYVYARFQKRGHATIAQGMDDRLGEQK